ncbi:unannotated protein [freshwater metagenome]|uniref:Unannotated protein n=1 Tax=freshwater metagenome TaxID=449393 RepID=A0A6J7ELX0_9ZZZZ
MVPKQFQYPPWGAGQRPIHAEYEPAQIGRMQPVGIFTRIDQLDHPMGVDVRGQRQLNDEPGALGILVESVHGIFDLLLTRGRRQPDLNRMQSHLGAVAMLRRDIGTATRIVAHQNRAQTGPNPLLGEPFDAVS